jgi:hypothetical protein
MILWNKLLKHSKSKQGLNKLAMQTWLTEININVEKLAIHSFVHLPLELAQRVWKLVLHKRCEGRYRAAITDKAGTAPLCRAGVPAGHPKPYYRVNRP